jgi:hypothetical protein
LDFWEKYSNITDLNFSIDEVEDLKSIYVIIKIRNLAQNIAKEMEVLKEKKWYQKWWGILIIVLGVLFCLVQNSCLCTRCKKKHKTEEKSISIIVKTEHQPKRFIKEDNDMVKKQDKYQTKGNRDNANLSYHKEDAHNRSLRKSREMLPRQSNNSEANKIQKGEPTRPKIPHPGMNNQTHQPIGYAPYPMHPNPQPYNFVPYGMNNKQPFTPYPMGVPMNPNPMQQNPMHHNAMQQNPMHHNAMHHNAMQQNLGNNRINIQDPGQLPFVDEKDDGLPVYEVDLNKANKYGDKKN